jgi:hypothetical protein
MRYDVRAFLYAARPYFIASLFALAAGFLVSELFSQYSLLADRWRGGPRLRWSGIDAGLIVALITLMVASAYWWHRIDPLDLRARTRTLRREPVGSEPREFVVFFLSNVDTTHFPTSLAPEGLKWELGADLEMLRVSGAPYWPWEQVLRAIRPHLNSLRGLYCVCSPESLPQAPRLVEILRQYGITVPFSVVVSLKGGGYRYWELTGGSDGAKASADFEGIPFEDFDLLSGAMRWLLDDLFVRAGKSGEHAERAITVDFTGGQKVTSVVAVAATFNSNVSAQYVDTDVGKPLHERRKEVYSYEVVIDFSRKNVPGALI